MMRALREPDLGRVVAQPPMHLQLRPHIGVVVVGDRIGIAHVGGQIVRRRVLPGFEQQHAAVRRRGQPVGQHAAGRAATDDDGVVVLVVGFIDPDFVAKHLGPDNNDDRKILYEDPDLRFCILAHVYKGEKNSNPHDHGPSWAVYGQVAGVTEMTDWRLLEKPQNGAPGKVAKVKTYALTPGIAHVYNEGVLHSPRRAGDTRLIRIEGQDLTKV